LRREWRGRRRQELGRHEQRIGQVAAHPGFNEGGGYRRIADHSLGLGQLLTKADDQAAWGARDADEGLRTAGRRLGGDSMAAQRLRDRRGQRRFAFKLSPDRAGRRSGAIGQRGRRHRDRQQA
jgi:hypothetical protein